MTDAAARRRFDVMGGPDIAFDTMEGGREPEGTSPDLMAVPGETSDVMARGREPAREGPA